MRSICEYWEGPLSAVNNPIIPYVCQLEENWNSHTVFGNKIQTFLGIIDGEILFEMDATKHGVND